MRLQVSVVFLALLSLTACSTSSDKTQPIYNEGALSVYKAGDIPLPYPESLLTGQASTECLKWSDSDIIATDKLFLFNAAGLSPAAARSLAVRLDREIDKLSASMDWASYRWLNSLPVVNQPNGAALFADSVVTLDRNIGVARLKSEMVKPPHEADQEKRGRNPDVQNKDSVGSVSHKRKLTREVAVLSYVLPEFRPRRDWRAPAAHVYEHFLKLPRPERVEAVRRYNRLSELDLRSDTFEILPGRILVCAFRESSGLGVAEGHDMGINLPAGSSDQDIRRALVASYQAVRTRAYGQLDDLVPEWFLTGQRQYHAGGHIASTKEALYSSPIDSRSARNHQKPDNFAPLSALAYRYLGAANEMSLISSLLDAVRYRDMPALGGMEQDPQRHFRKAFDNRMQALDDGPLTIRGFDYGWNGFIGSLPEVAFK